MQPFMSFVTRSEFLCVRAASLGRLPDRKDELVLG